MGIKAVGTEAGKWFGVTYIGGQTFGIGATWGGVVGAAIGGTITSAIVDRLERLAFRYIGIE